MSRIGKSPINFTTDVNVSYKDTLLTISGPKGKLERFIDPLIELKVENNIISLTPKKINNDTKAKWGLYRALVNNMVQGVTSGFSKTLEINGVGYKAKVQGDYLNLSLGFSHEIKIEIPEEIKVSSPKATIVEISSHDKEKLGQFAANIRRLRPPEPYKGKGVKYSDEYIIRKVGKK